MIDASDWNIPDNWRAASDAATPEGHAAQFRSAAHAIMAARVHYLRCNPDLAAEPVDHVIIRYEDAWTVFTDHCQNVVTVVAHVEHGDLVAAANVWNSIDQPKVNKAFTSVLGEAEPLSDRGRVSRNLSHFACKAFLPTSPVVKVPLDRKVTAKDGNDAWDRAGGHCLSCRTVTNRTSKHQKLRRLFRSNSDGFNLAPTYVNTKGAEVPLWSERILIAAKGTPDHVVAASRGGLATPDNLVNVCAACQFARGNWTLDDLSIPTYGTR